MKVNWCADSSNRVTCHDNSVIGLEESYLGRIWYNDDRTWGASTGKGESVVILGNAFNNGGVARRAVEAAVGGSQVNEWE